MLIHSSKDRTKVRTNKIYMLKSVFVIFYILTCVLLLGVNAIDGWENGGLNSIGRKMRTW